MVTIKSFKKVMIIKFYEIKIKFRKIIDKIFDIKAYKVAKVTPCPDNQIDNAPGLESECFMLIFEDRWFYQNL